MNTLLLKKLWFWIDEFVIAKFIWLIRPFLNLPNKFGGYWRPVGLFLLTSLFGFTACQKEVTPPIENNTDGFQKGVFISNEGNFRSGNASVTFYNPTTQEVQEKIFESANNQALGDILQSISFIEDKAFLVVNNSNKIEVVNAVTFEKIKTINDLISPRYLQIIDKTTAYISDIYANKLTILDLPSMAAKSSIPFSGWSEQMVKVGNEVFVTKPSDLRSTLSNHIYIINTLKNEVMDSVEVAFDPISIVTDRNNKIWVLCNGELSTNNLGGLYRINPTSKEVELSLPFPDFEKSLSPHLVLNSAKDQLYFLKKDVYTLAIDATNFPTIPLIEALGRDLYGLGIHPNTDDIYVGDSGNFTQRGTVTIHNQEGIELSSFKAGVGINGFYFRE